MKRLLLILALCTLTACSTLDKIDIDSATTRFATQYATLKYIEDGNNIDTDKAQRVYAHAKAVRDYLSKDTAVSVDDLERYIVARVDWTRLSAADALAARTFVNYLAMELQSRIDGDNYTDRLVVARDLVDLVASTLEPYI